MIVCRYQFFDGYENEGTTENGEFQDTKQARRDRSRTNYYGVDSEPNEYPDTDDDGDDVGEGNGKQDGMAFQKTTLILTYREREREREKVAQIGFCCNAE